MSEGIGTAPSPAPQPGPGEANPPPPSEGTRPGGEIDTAVPGTEPPPPWTPPAHWPPLPAGVSPDALAHWIAANRQTDAIASAEAANRENIAVQREIRDHMAAAMARPANVSDAYFLAEMFGACAAAQMTEASVRSRAAKLLAEFRKLVPAS